jgi:predicted nucleotidyltransferase
MFSNVLTALRAIDLPLELAVVFGSLARGGARAESDLDIAVRFRRALSTEEKTTLIQALAATTGRPVDLIDLRVAGPIVARQALTEGKRIFGTDEHWAAQVAQTLVDYADFAPLVDRVLRERRESWIQA